ncbi:MAG: right-handed parallel beta-helix repeat-containing protein [Methanoregula sp.]|uniref:right-handed parallel beta-helix repeat-containing protein n=1 Tax=Methanoregula sp. TaxID=2052170 RepID=UPI003D09BA6A
MIVPPVLAATLTINPGDSIQTAINNANSGDTIILNPGIYQQNNITVSKNITIGANTSYGGNRLNTIIDGMLTNSIFIVTGSSSLTINDLTLKDGTNTIGDGGAISAGGGTVTVTSSTITNCSVTSIGSAGGAIYASGGTVTVTSSTISNCSATDYGGAISAGGGTAIVTSSTITNCSANFGGAIYAGGIGAVTVTYSTITNCSAYYEGGAIYASGTIGTITITVTSSTITNCSAYYKGGAISTTGTVTVTIEGSSTITNCSVTGNLSQGGAIYSDGLLTIMSSTFTNCSVTDTQGSGGAILSIGPLTITSSTFTNCSVPTNGSGADGGAISSVGPLTINSSTFINCSAQCGGAIFSYDSILTINSSTFINCSAIQGGAIYSWSGGSVSIDSTTFTNCSAQWEGGAIYVKSIPVTITSSTFTNCSAQYGGAIDADGGTTINVNSSTFTNCSASIGCGGAIYAGIPNSVPGTPVPVTVTINSSTFTNCSAPDAGAIYAYQDATVTIHFSRIANCPGNVDGGEIDAGPSGSNADNNWWGSNANPQAQVPGFTVNSWLVLGSATPAPSSISSGGTSTIQVNLTYDSNGVYHDPASGHVPDGTPVTFTNVSGPGSVLPLAGNTINGANTTTFLSNGAGTATVNATVDGQQVSAVILISVTQTTPPAASFSANQTGGIAPLTVQFTDTSTGSPVSWNWSFGDGIFSTLQNPVYTYTQTDDTPRSYDVSLNVTNAAGQFNTSLQTGYIHVMSFSEYYRSISGAPGNIDTATFVQIVEDWRLQRPVSTFTVSPSTPVFVGLVEDWRLQRPLT